MHGSHWVDIALRARFPAAGRPAAARAPDARTTSRAWVPWGKGIPLPSRPSHARLGRPGACFRARLGDPFSTKTRPRARPAPLARDDPRVPRPFAGPDRPPVRHESTAPQQARAPPRFRPPPLAADDRPAPGGARARRRRRSSPRPRPTVVVPSTQAGHVSSHVSASRWHGRLRGGGGRSSRGRSGSRRGGRCGGWSVAGRASGRRAGCNWT